MSYSYAARVSWIPPCHSRRALGRHCASATPAGISSPPIPYNIRMQDILRIAGREFSSRLFVGTGKYRSFQEMARCHAASGAEVVTVAVRRVNLTDKSKESLIDYIDRAKMFILPNTAACYTAEEAIRTARLGREVGLSNWVKLEVIGDEQTLFPDNEGLMEATRVLAKEGFVVLPYTTDDLIIARKLIDAGAAAVMPLGAPIGSGLGIQNSTNLRILRERITEVPLIVDAGVGTASDAAIAMELGYDGVLMNTAIAAAEDSEKMAEAMKHAVIAGTTRSPQRPDAEEALRDGQQSDGRRRPLKLLATDTERPHSLVQVRALHSQRPRRAGYIPICGIQRFLNVVTFRRFTSLLYRRLRRILSITSGFLSELRPIRSDRPG